MKQIQKGFTLIELMIVVAIIGILAAIALPQYENYVAKSQLSEAFVMLDGLKTPMTESYSQDGTWAIPTTSQLVTAGKYVSTILAAGSGPYTLTATFRAGASKKIQTSSVVFTYTPAPASGVSPWQCSFTNIPTEIQPKSCP